MATMNPFDLLNDDVDGNEDPTQLIAAAQKVEKTKKPAPITQVNTAKPAKLPTKPPPPSQAVREAKTDPGRGGGRGGRFYRDSSNNKSSFGNNNSSVRGYRPSEEGDSEKPSERREPSERRGYSTPRGSFRGGRRGGFNNGEAGEGERPRRIYERRSGTGHGNEFKRDGAGRGNWGTASDEISPDAEEPTVETEKKVIAEKQSGEEGAADVKKENPVDEPEEKEPDEKEMTLEEYEKLLEEKRKTLLALKTEERKVDADKEFGSMQPLSNKKNNVDVFIKLGSEKDKRKDAADKEEKVKKSVSINEFLKPAEGERSYNPGGRGRGRGRRGGFGGGSFPSNVGAPSIEDPGHFPSLGAK
ncbi:U3 small nucleolar RNA-associated protein 25 [Tripterygium wilfordii]|uniref:U3 small nucleolar RNA-associated protein 25 n=1 Tax=Tripterygium wilfordii TaxID=458696 RepID=A0A7J7CM76_TRIWF|nr:RGG repeats nuclear RNA binding protein A-like [Tripterygium wilfordii]KAF5735128.1 U3 small nucleolar RNA-associated protein 25 [Tripterygium wilfordii]